MCGDNYPKNFEEEPCTHRHYRPSLTTSAIDMIADKKKKGLHRHLNRESTIAKKAF
jgi:hypothetical protein